MSHRGSLAFDKVDGFDHVLAQLHATICVVISGHGQTGHAVITISQKLNTKAVADLVEERKKVFSSKMTSSKLRENEIFTASLLSFVMIISKFRVHASLLEP